MLHALLIKFRLWVWKRRYRPGRVITKFLAPDIRRDIEVVDVSQIDAGIISARIRTWNVLYAYRRNSPPPPYEDIREVNIKDLGEWKCESQGG